MRAISRASRIPCSPVQAFALPLFSRTACPCPERTRSISRRTGAALTLLVVNTPAAAAGTRDTTRARSFFCALIPQCTPAATKPCADVTPPWIKRVTPLAIAPPPHLCSNLCLLFAPLRFGAPAGGTPARSASRSLGVEGGDAEPGGLRQPQHQVQVLQGLSGGPLAEIVDRGNRDRHLRACVHPHRHVAVVGPQRRLGLGQGAVRQDPHKRLGCVGLAVEPQ